MSERHYCREGVCLAPGLDEIADQKDATIATLRAELATALATIAERDQDVEQMRLYGERITRCYREVVTERDAALARETALREALRGIFEAFSITVHSSDVFLSTSRTNKAFTAAWKTLCDTLAAIAAQPPAAAALEPSAECTGVAASWCPNHGTCTCVRRWNGEWDEHDPNCPLHSDASNHAESQPAAALERREAEQRVEASLCAWMRCFNGDLAIQEDWALKKAVEDRAALDAPKDPASR